MNDNLHPIFQNIVNSQLQLHDVKTCRLRTIKVDKVKLFELYKHAYTEALPFGSCTDVNMIKERFEEIWSCMLETGDWF